MGTSVLPQSYLTAEEYLTIEDLTGIKYEYLGGVIYAIAGASDSHNRIALALYGMLYNRLRGRSCEAFSADMKVRLQLQSSRSTCFYYPDAMIDCNSPDVGSGWRERPAALFEIVSESTRQIDEREKRAAYLDLGSLEAYVRLEPDRPEAVIESRTIEGWKLERLTGLDAIISLPTLEIELSLAELYERVTFPKSTEPSAVGGASA